MVNTSLTKLEPGDCTPDKQTGKMSKALKEAYDIAEERHDLDHFKNMLEEFMQAQKQAAEEDAAKQADKEAKAAKKAEKAAADKTKEKKDRRKSKSKETVSDADDMDLDIPEDAATKPTKKRKKDAESEGEGPKAPKVTATKTNGESAKKVAKPRKVVQKPADEEPVTEAEKLERREKAVLYLRHRLQKGFLMRDQAPKEEEMATMDDFFNQLEAYTNLEPAIIRGTKIYKVLRGVVKLSSIPKEEEYQFKKRSNDLLASWHEALGSKGDEKEDEKVEDNSEKAEKPEEVVEKAESKEPTEAPSNPEAAEDKDVAMTDVKEDKVEAAPAADTETAAAE
jgi:hypothetical protein